MDRFHTADVAVRFVSGGYSRAFLAVRFLAFRFPVPVSIRGFPAKRGEDVNRSIWKMAGERIRSELAIQQLRQHVRPPRGEQGGRSRARGRACGLNCGAGYGGVHGEQHPESLLRPFFYVFTEDVPTVDCSMGQGEGEQGQPLHALREVPRQRKPSVDSATIGCKSVTHFCFLL